MKIVQKSSGDTEGTQNSRVNHMTLTCDLESMKPGHVLTERNILVKFNENRSKGSEDTERTRIEW